MKKTFTLAPVLLLMLFTFFSCSDLMDEFGRTGKVKKNLLKEFAYGDRHYEFTYNTDGNVRQIRAYSDGLEYFYNVAYQGTEIDSVSLIDGGEVISTHKEFMYDKDGKITGFTYSLPVPDLPGGFNTPYYIEYDSKDRIISIDGISKYKFIYGNKRNIHEWIDLNYTPGKSTFYTYDKGLNPLYEVKNLFVLLTEETAFWEYLLSENNSLTKTTPDGNTTTYTNVYDKRKRLIEKTGISRGETTDHFTFTYF